MKDSPKKEEGVSNPNSMSVEDRYTQWKSLVPVLYDWLANHNLVWPSQSCRWGSVIDHATYKNRHRLYLSEQTDGTVPNTLVIATCEVVKPRVAAAEHIAQVTIIHSFIFRLYFIFIFIFILCIVCFSQINYSIFQFNEEARSPFVKKHKTILHPGEVQFLHFLFSFITRLLLLLLCFLTFIFRVCFNWFI